MDEIYDSEGDYHSMFEFTDWGYHWCKSRRNAEEFMNLLEKRCERSPTDLGNGLISEALYYIDEAKYDLKLFAKASSPLTRSDYIFVKSSLLKLKYWRELVKQEFFDDKYWFHKDRICPCSDTPCVISRLKAVYEFYKKSKFYNIENFKNYFRYLFAYM